MVCQGYCGKTQWAQALALTPQNNLGMNWIADLHARPTRLTSEPDSDNALVAEWAQILQPSSKI